MPSINSLTNKTDQIVNRLIQLEQQVRDIDTLVRLSKQAANNSALLSVTATTFSTSTGGPTVTVNIGPSKRALVSLDAFINPSTTANLLSALMGFSIAGSTSRNATDVQSLILTNETLNTEAQFGATFLVTGLSTGVNTVTARYRQTGGGNTAFFENRTIIVEPF